jgi:hypothetical protein
MPIVNYASDVKPFDDDSGTTVWTDAEIATQLNAQTAFDIDAATGRQSFAVLGWWYQNQDSTWAGTIQEIQNDPAAPGAVTDFINSVWLRVYGAAASSCGTGLIYDWMGSVDPDQLAAQWAGLFTWGNANGHPFTVPAIESFYSSGGGLKYPGQDVTEPDVALSRIVWNEQQALIATKQRLDAQYSGLYNQFVSPIYSSDNPAEVTDTAMKAALQSMHDNWIDGA